MQEYEGNKKIYVLLNEYTIIRYKIYVLLNKNTITKPFVYFMFTAKTRQSQYAQRQAEVDRHQGASI